MRIRRTKNLADAVKKNWQVLAGHYAIFSKSSFPAKYSFFKRSVGWRAAAPLFRETGGDRQISITAELLNNFWTTARSNSQATSSFVKTRDCSKHAFLEAKMSNSGTKKMPTTCYFLILLLYFLLFIHIITEAPVTVRNRTKGSPESWLGNFLIIRKSNSCTKFHKEKSLTWRH